jgi:superfamily II DNA/RNA helicase
MNTPTFAELGVPDRLIDVLTRQSIVEPFPIQAVAIPDLLQGRDVLGRAPTGSGKTLAFGLPLVAGVAQRRSRRPRALVLAPTRELAEQISRELIPLAKAAGRYVLAVYGGVGYGFQRSSLRRGVDILVACPGRLTDLLAEGSADLSDVEFVVIDEADRMADMGFMPQVRELLDQTPSRRQTALFSATLDGDVADLTRRYQTDPARHEVESPEEDGSKARHFFWRVEPGERVARTAQVVAEAPPTLVFTRTRRGADRLAAQLVKQGVSTEAIHGGRNQSQRTRALRAFSTGRVAALVATDVAARGIHVVGVAAVVHFDPPADAKAYLHRSGRTARVGETGIVLSLVLQDQVRFVRSLQRDMGLAGSMAAPDFSELLTGGVRMRPGHPGDQRAPGSRPQPRPRSAHRSRSHRRTTR